MTTPGNMYLLAGSSEYFCCLHYILWRLFVINVWFTCDWKIGRCYCVKLFNFFSMKFSLVQSVQKILFKKFVWQICNILASELAKQLERYWGGFRFLTKVVNRMESLELVVWLWKNGFSRNLHLRSVLIWDLQHSVENQVIGTRPYHDWAKILVISNETSELAICLWIKCTCIDFCLILSFLPPLH